MFKNISLIFELAKNMGYFSLDSVFFIVVVLGLLRYVYHLKMMKRI